MTITYPRDLPEGHISKCIFTLLDNVSASPSAGGSFINLSQVNDEVWSVEIETGLLDVAKKFEWSAWKKSLRGGLKMFIAYDQQRKTPLAYPNAKQSSDISSGWDGDATVETLEASGQLGLSGLPAGYIASAGDRVGLFESDHFGYYEILENVTANGSGEATLTVSPFLQTSIFTTDAVATLWRPKCQFVIDWQSWTGDGGINEPSAASFKGFQRL